MRNDKVFPTLCMLVGLACWLVLVVVWKIAAAAVGFLTPAPKLTWDVEIEDAPTPKGKQVTAAELREAFQ